MEHRTNAIEKNLSRNDTGETGAHQAGILIPKKPEILSFFPELNKYEKNPRFLITFHDDFGEQWSFSFIYYNNKFYGGTRNEYRLTGMTKFIRNNNIGDRVKLLGYQNNPWKFMSKSELFILPSIWEGFGNVIVESMLIGIPVISSDCPSGPREILNDGANGKLFKVGDYNHLAKTIEDILSGDNTELINRARIRSKDFSIEKITQEYEKILIH